MTKQYKPVLGALLLLIVTLPVCAVQDGSDEAAKPAGEAEVLAYVGDEAITKAEVDEAIESQLIKIRQQEYDLRRQAIEQIVVRKLLEKEAAGRGVTLAELGKIEVQDKAGEVTEAMVKEIYETNKNHRSIQGKALEEVRPLIEQNAVAQLVDQRRRDYIEELKARADIRVLVDPPRLAVNVPDTEPALGPLGAPVTMVEFADFQCGYCKRSVPTIDRILAEYGDKIRFVYRDYALDFHPRAEPAAVAARCAGDQGKYWDYHRDLMTNSGSLNDDDLKARAQKLGLDVAAFTGCYESDRHLDAVQSGFEDGGKVGVTGTPTFFINGRMIVGAVSYEELKTIIDEELQRAETKKS